MFTEQQLQQLGRAHHQGYLTRCPSSKTPLRTEDGTYMGKASSDVFFLCERCQESGRFEAVDVGGEWTPEQKATIVDQFWQRGAALCPDDDCQLSLFKDPSLGSKYVHARCPYCGKNFYSQ